MFVADFCNDSTYKFPAAAPPNPIGRYDATTATKLANGIDGGLAAQNGLYYGIQAFHGADDGVYLFDPGTLVRGNRISTFSCVPIGVVGDPQTPAIYVTTLCGIYVIADPTVATPTATLFASTTARSYDGIYFTSDGNHLWTAFIAPTSGSRSSAAPVRWSSTR